MRVLNKDEIFYRKDYFLSKINEGAIFVHPTDTIYGLGCSALNPEVISKLRELKKRSKQPFSIIAPSKEWIMENCHVDENARDWVEKLPGPYTLILELKNRDAVSSMVNSGEHTIGVRIPDHWLSSVVSELGVPIITTSANRVGETYMTSLDNLHESIQHNVDMVIYEAEKPGEPSRIVNLMHGREVIER